MRHRELFTPSDLAASAGSGDNQIQPSNLVHYKHVIGQKVATAIPHPKWKDKVLLAGWNLAEHEQGTATWVQTHSFHGREPYPHLSYQATSSTSGTPRCCEDSHDHRCSGMSNGFLRLTPGPFVNIYTVPLAIQEGDNITLHNGLCNNTGNFFFALSKRSPKVQL